MQHRGKGVAGDAVSQAEALTQLLRLQPGHVGAAVELATVMIRRGDRRGALDLVRPLAGSNDLDAGQCDAIGTILTLCEEPSLALPLFERAVAAHPDHPQLLYNLAASERMNGRFEAAERHLDRVIELTPEDAQAWHTRSDLRRQTAAHNHVTALRLRAARAGGKDAVLLNYALGKELEDLGDHRAAFAALKTACDTQRRAMRYDVAEDVATIELLIEKHHAKVIGAGEGFDSREPIFVIGLPRSGTTLVDRILGSHSAISNAGELNAFAMAAVRGVGEQVDKKSFVERALAIDPARLGQAYLDETRPQTGQRPHFTDKMPLNYLYAGLIRRALPNARLIALDRHPLDVCYAMYKMLFIGAYPFSYDLGDLARYYAAWSRLMAHWRVVLGPALLTVRYEDLVEQPEEQTRRMIDFLGLPWEEGCLSFHKRAEAVSTASAVQVRAPVHRQSMGRWRSYADELKPLIDGLRAEGVALDL